MPSILPCCHLDILANTSLKTVESKLPTFIFKIGCEWNKILVFLYLSQLWTNPIQVNFSIFVVLWNNSAAAELFSDCICIFISYQDLSLTSLLLSTAFVTIVISELSNKDCAKPNFNTENINQGESQALIHGNSRKIKNKQHIKGNAPPALSPRQP